MLGGLFMLAEPPLTQRPSAEIISFPNAEKRARIKEAAARGNQVRVAALRDVLARAASIKRLVSLLMSEHR